MYVKIVISFPKLAENRMYQNDKNRRPYSKNLGSGGNHPSSVVLLQKLAQIDEGQTNQGTKKQINYIHTMIYTPIATKL